MQRSCQSPIRPIDAPKRIPPNRPVRGNQWSGRLDLEPASAGASAPVHSFSVDVGANMNALTERATVETSLGYNGHTLSFRLVGQPNRIDGEAKFDGMLYAEITIISEQTPTSVTTTMTIQRRTGGR